MGHQPLVSAVIIFYNEERFLDEAVESVLAQTYGHWELLLCDDGSTDGSTAAARAYAKRHPDRIRYLEHEGHENEGMSATRNLGLSHARGDYVSWLDADDIWLPNKLERQVRILEEHPEAAMVYGRLHLWYGWTGKEEDRRRDFVQDLGGTADTLIHPPELLKRFLRDDMHTPSGVLIRRSVLEEVGGYDESFRGMHEDGIVHAKVCLEWPVYASGETWYRYRQHPNSECNRSISAGTDRRALVAFLEWLEVYLDQAGMTDTEVGELVQDLLRSARGEAENTLARRARRLSAMALRRGREIADRAVPGPVRRLVGLLAFGKRLRPPSGWLHFGNLRRVTPVSRVFGFDRGRPIDRYYIERFLETYADDIRGRVLEVGDRAYTTRFGGQRVTRSDVLHARSGNREATLVGDLGTGVGIPEEAFDSIILTQVLPFIWDFEAALGNVERALKPGGVLLMTLPGISQISRFDADRWGDYWRFTSMSARRLVESVFPPEKVQIEVFGNVLAATAFLNGVAAEELRSNELDYKDRDYEVIISVRASKQDADARE